MFLNLPTAFGSDTSERTRSAAIEEPLSQRRVSATFRPESVSLRGRVCLHSSLQRPLLLVGSVGSVSIFVQSLSFSLQSSREDIGGAPVAEASPCHVINRRVVPLSVHLLTVPSNHRGARGNFFLLTPKKKLLGAVSVCHQWTL